MNNSTAFRIRTFRADTHTHRQDTTSNILNHFRHLVCCDVHSLQGHYFFFFSDNCRQSLPVRTLHLANPAKKISARKGKKSVWQMWRVSATGRQTFPVALPTASKRLILSAIQWSKTRGSPFKANWNSGERCARWRHVIRSEWRKTRAVTLKVRPHRTRSAAADCGLCPLRNVTF